MITKQQRTELRSKAQKIKPTVWIGKEGFSAKVIEQIASELYDHELIKIAIGENCPVLNEFEQAQLAATLGADIVTLIGKKLVLYKKSTKKGLKPVL